MPLNTSRAFVIGLFLFPFVKAFSQSDELNAVFADLIYDPTKSYSSGSAVVVSLEDGEIYTASQDVPAADDGSNGPNGANASTYWGDSASTTEQFEENNPSFLNDLPSDINTTELSTAVAQLTDPSSTTTKNDGDLNGDGIPDIVWQKSGTSDVKFWFMNTDGSVKEELDLDHGASDDWKVSSMGDMNSDGLTDLLWQHNDGSTVFCYHMDGTGKVDSGKSLASGVIPGWRFVSAADFNKDGDLDFLWHSTSQGSTVCWHFDGKGVVNGFSPLGSGIVDYFISFSGNDMNSDNYSDVIYQNINNGMVLVWYFDDKKNILGTKTYIKSMNPVLRVSGVYDYNNDSGVDLLLQDDSTGVAKIVYFDDNGTQLSEKEIGTIDTSVLWEIRN